MKKQDFDFRIYQIVGGGRYKKGISFERLVKKTKFKFHWYEENCYLMGFWLPKAHFTIYQTGSFIINGVKSMKDVKESIKLMSDEITKAKAWKN